MEVELSKDDPGGTKVEMKLEETSSPSLERDAEVPSVLKTQICHRHNLSHSPPIKVNPTKAKEDLNFGENLDKNQNNNKRRHIIRLSHRSHSLLPYVSRKHEQSCTIGISQLKIKKNSYCSPQQQA